MKVSFKIQHNEHGVVPGYPMALLLTRETGKLLDGDSFVQFAEAGAKSLKFYIQVSPHIIQILRILYQYSGQDMICGWRKCPWIRLYQAM